MKKTKIFFLKYLLILFCITIIFQSNCDLSSMIKVYDNDYEEILAIEECDDYVCALYKTNDSHVKLMIFKNNSYFGSATPGSNSLNVYYCTDDFPMYIIYGKKDFNDGYYIYDTGSTMLKEKCSGIYVLDIHLLKDTYDIVDQLGNGKYYSNKGIYLFDF